jgi:hypothetical protein
MPWLPLLLALTGCSGDGTEAAPPPGPAPSPIASPDPGAVDDPLAEARALFERRQALRDLAEPTGNAP